MLDDVQPRPSSSTATTHSMPSSPDALESRLSTIRATLLSLPEELCAAASSSTRTSKPRITMLSDELHRCIEYSRHNPASPKWGHVARLVRLGSTSRGYVGAAPGVRVGDLRPVELGDYKFLIPETEEEWLECERRWQERFTAPVGEKERASKYWERKEGKGVEVKEVSESVKVVQTRVANWRAEVLREGPEVPQSQSAVDKEKSSERAKEKVSMAAKPRKQAQLSFTCAKRSSIQTTKPKGPRPPTPPALEIPSNDADQPLSGGPTTANGVLKTASYQTISWPPPGQAEGIARGLLPAYTGSGSKEKASSATASLHVSQAEPPSEERAELSAVPVDVRAATVDDVRAPSPVPAPEEDSHSAGDAIPTMKTVPSEPSELFTLGPVTGEGRQSGHSHIPSWPAGQAEAIAAALISVSSGPTRITEVSEMSFLPPSFPSELRTSTPQPVDKAKPPSKRKPSPIPHEPHLTQSPMSVQSFPLPAVERAHEVPHASSSLPPETPTRIGTKRPRHSTPTPLGGDANPPNGLSYVTPPPKRARGEPQPESSGGAPPPSTPPPPPSSDVEMGHPRTPPPPILGDEFMVAARNPKTPPRPASTSKGLGNANGLPVPTTPNNQLPTLTELLASSRRSKPRPRPPSRKSSAVKPTAGLSRFAPTLLPGEDVLPTVVDPIEEASSAGDDQHDPSPAKSVRSYFSSPASGSTESPMSIHSRPRSPVSPLFTQQPDVFAPALASTQRLDVRQGGLLRQAGSGFFGMAYSSQFDVEAGIGRVSELLERDVDFEGWLREVPEEGEEGAKGVSQSQEELAV